jgi:hypothetical protein
MKVDNVDVNNVVGIIVGQRSSAFCNPPATARNPARRLRAIL